MRHLILSLLLTASLTGIAQELENVTVDGKSRTMLVHAPADLPSANAPLVISLHGFNQDAGYQRDQTQWNVCADSAKFVVVYPNAIDSWWDVYGTSDIVFLEWVIDNMYDRYKIDRNRVYITGFSLGSMMTYHCMEHMADKVAAFGPVSGVRFDNKAPNAPRRVPFIHTHGKADDVFKWTGDPGHMAGGYPYIPDYVESWATYEGLTQKEVIDPYPAEKANSNADLTIWRSTDPNDDIEVALLALDGKGHWHSEDIWGGVSTTQEIWKFCKRYSLGPSAPALVNIEPENMSFDLTDQTRTFTISLSGVVDIADIKAQLTSSKVSIDLLTQEGQNSSTVTFVVPNDAQIPDGEYKLHITDIKNPEGGDPANYTFSYTYGFFEPGDELKVETLFVTDWAQMESELGEGIPYGWHRVNSRNNGSTDTRESGEANITGARLKYFHEGGDFDAGFYLSAREYDKCVFSYGLYDDYPFVLEPGKYSLSFKSTYWNQSAQDAATTFSAFVSTKNEETNLLNVEVTPTGCLNESTVNPVTKAATHDLSFEVEQKGEYTFGFTMSRGWNAVIVAEPKITTAPCAADIYKGGFQRVLARAITAYELSADATESYVTKARKRTKKYIDKYIDLVSTAPSVYIKAIQDLSQYLDVLEEYVAGLSGINAINNDSQTVSSQYYTIDGRLVSNPQSGMYIRIDRYDNGSASASKVYIKQ